MIGGLGNPGVPTAVLSATLIVVCLVQIAVKVVAAHNVTRPNDEVTSEEQKHRRTATIWLLPAALYATVIVTALALDKVSKDTPKFDLNAALAATCAAIALGCLVYTWLHVLWERHEYKWALIAAMLFAATAHATMSFELWLFADTAHRYPLVDSVAHLKLWTFEASVLLALVALALAIATKVTDKG